MDKIVSELLKACKEAIGKSTECPDPEKPMEIQNEIRALLKEAVNKAERRLIDRGYMNIKCQMREV